MSVIKERILQIAEYKGIKKTKFPEILDMSYSNFKGTALNTPINSDTIAKILSMYPEIDLHWLITGKEQQKEKENLNIVSEPQNSYNKKDYKELYIEVLEENREIKNELISLLKKTGI